MRLAEGRRKGRVIAATSVAEIKGLAKPTLIPKRLMDNLVTDGLSLIDVLGRAVLLDL